MLLFRGSDVYQPGQSPEDLQTLKQKLIHWVVDLHNKGVHVASEPLEPTGKQVSGTKKTAYWHTIKADTKEKWENILQLYNHLLLIEYSPIAALNRTYALAKVNGKKEAIIEAEKINLTDNHLYHSLLGELYTDIDNTAAISHLQNALALARSTADKTLISNKILECRQKKTSAC